MAKSLKPKSAPAILPSVDASGSSPSTSNKIDAKYFPDESFDIVTVLISPSKIVK